MSKEGVIEIPQELKVIAIPSSWLDYEQVIYHGEPVLIIKNKKIELNGGSIINLIPKGAFKLKIDDIRVVKYLTIDSRGKKPKLKGTIVLERTDKTIGTTPVFKISQKDPEAFMYGFIIGDFEECGDVKIEDVKNVIQKYIRCISNNDETVAIAIDLIIPVEKTAIIDYVVRGGKHRDMIIWNNGDPIELIDIYEEPTTDDIL